jgi:hypothetical protein
MFPLPSWVTLLIVLVIFGLVLYIKWKISKEGLTQYDFMVAAGEAFFMASIATLCIRVFYCSATGELHLPSGPLEPPDPILAVALFLLALLLTFIHGYWRRWKMTQSK